MTIAGSDYLNAKPRSIAQAEADRAANDWAYQATHPTYDLLRGQEGSPRHVATKGMTDAQIIARDAAATPARLGSWLAQMASESVAKKAAE